jgi:hypothetical protein
MEFTVKIRDRIARVEKHIVLPAKSVETISVKFDLDDEWSSLSKTVVFLTRTKAVDDQYTDIIHEVLYKASGTVIPWENLEEGRMYITLIGRANSGAKLATTLMPEAIRVDAPAAVTGEDPEDYTPSILDQALNAAAEAAEARDACEQYFNDCAFLAEQATGAYHAAEQEAERAATHSASAERSATNAQASARAAAGSATDAADSRDQALDAQIAAAGSQLIAQASASDAEGFARRAEQALEEMQSGGAVDEMDLAVDEGLNRLFITAKGQKVGQGVEVPGGLAFDGGEFNKVDESGDEGENYYLHLMMGDEDIEGFTPIPVPSDMGGGGGGGGYDSRIVLKNTTGASSFAIPGGSSPVMLSYRWSSTDTDGNDTGEATSVYWAVNKVQVAVQPNVEQGDQSFNIRPYLKDGVKNDVRITIEDSLGTRKSLTWHVTSMVFDLTWRLSDFPIAGTGSLPVVMVPTGIGEKTIHLSVADANGVHQEIYTETTTGSGTSINTTIPAQSHGAHEIKAWITATVNGSSFSTEPLVAVGLWEERGNVTPFVAMKVDKTEVQKYGVVNVQFVAYNPANADSATVTETVNGNPVNTLTVNRNVQTWQYRATAVGSVTLGVNIGGHGSTAVITVTDVDEGIQEVTGGLELKLDPTGHNNSEANRTSFGYTDENGTNHPLLFSANFDWTNGGFQTDEDGTAFVVKRGSWAELPISFFGEFDPVRGKEIKLIFKSKNVRDYDAELIRCYPGTGNPGIVVNAQNTTVYSSGQGASVPYVEERLIEMDVNISTRNEGRLLMIWLKGIPSRVIYYGNDSFEQGGAAQYVHIGSADADVWVYKVRMYKASLTRADILKNWVADAKSVEEMLARFNNNDIFSTDSARSLDPNKLAIAAPNLRQLRITASKMTTGKKDRVPCTVQQVYPAGATQSGNRHNWTARNVLMSMQGSSSLDYFAAAPNLDLRFENATYWQTEDGDNLTAYSMTDQSIPVNWLCIKANVASSENANNVCLADEYHLFNPYVCAARQADPRTRDTIEGHPVVVFFTNPPENTEVVTVGSRPCNPGDTLLFFVGDMINSKNNVPVFGHTSAGHDLQCCIEIRNNNNPATVFKGPITAYETFEGCQVSKGDDHDDDFEFRYPDGNPTAGMIAAWREVHAWVCSTDPASATNAALPSYAVYDNVQYTNDTAAYRRAKFKAEVADHFVVDSLLWHYLFTERHLMVDSRAKNTFYSYDWIPSLNAYRWTLRNNYDDDTAEGNDNSGGLTFTYGMEDTDMVGNAYVFNGHDSVIWCNVRDCLSSELTAMYIDRESAGAWDAKRILKKFSDYQQQRPVALDAEDMWFKYITPFTIPAEPIARFLPMMLGRKEDQREQFETYQEYYIASKYGGDLWRNDFISMRGNRPTEWQGVEPSLTLEVEVYADCWPRVDFGNAAATNHPRARRGQTVTLVAPAGTNPTDLEIRVRGARMFKKIRGLPAYYSKTFAVPSAPKLTELEYGSRESGYANTTIGTDGGSLTIENMPLMEKLVLSGLPNVIQTLDLTKMTFLEEIYAEGSGFTGVMFAENAPIKKAVLPALTTLWARGLTQLQEFSMSGARLANVWVERTPMIDTYDLIAMSQVKPNRIRLLGVDWRAENADRVIPLTGASGYTGTGGNQAAPVLTGNGFFTIITRPELNAMAEKFPDFTVDYGTEVPTHTVTFVDYDGSVLHTEYNVRHGSDASNPVADGTIPIPTRPSTAYYSYTFAGWDKAFTNVTEDLTVTARYTQGAKTYTVRYWYDSSRARLLDTQTVEAGTAAVYGGTRPVKTGAVFSGWSDTPNRVVADMDIYAVFSSPVQPAVVAEAGTYTYLYSDDTSDHAAYNFSEFMWICLKAPNPWVYVHDGDKVRFLVSSENISDTEIVYIAAGKYHFKEVESGELADIVWLPDHLLNSTYYMNSSATNIGGWGAPSAMWNYLHNRVKPALPYHLQYIMAQIKVRYCSVVDSSRATEYLEVNSYMFTPSRYEANFGDFVSEIDGDVDAMNRVFTVFTDNPSRIMTTRSGSGGASWWLRSPYTGYTTHFYHVTASGTGTGNYASSALGVLCGFCTKSDHLG